MTSKELKYKELLAQFPNCPPEHYLEVQKEAFRWVHENEHENDFKPVNLINDPPQRILDDSDKICIGYGLSLFDNINNAYSRYKELYNNRRENKRIDFMNEIGKSIVTLQLDYSDGIANEPNNNGHFTFHEYDGVSLKDKMRSYFCIFDGNGNFVI